ncbi:MAG: hypothetical protein LC118_21565, partial [Dehalococcoidia bacterium]|nr:hypothetical protein [Dehalococcoidia bacterium]
MKLDIDHRRHLPGLSRRLPSPGVACVVLRLQGTPPAIEVKGPSGENFQALPAPFGRPNLRAPNTAPPAAIDWPPPLAMGVHHAANRGFPHRLARERDDRVVGMHQRPSPPPPLIPPAALAWLRKPQFLIPIAVVIGMTVIAFGVQPDGARGETPSKTRTTVPAPTAQQSPAPPTTPTTQPSPALTQQAPPSVSTTATAAASGQSQPGPASDVAGIQGTPAATPTAAEASLARQSTQCGSI